MSPRFSADDVPDQTGRTAVVTGATSGLGLETATALAAKGGRVMVGARDPDRGAAALERIRRTVPGADVEVLDLDLADLASVERAAAVVADRVDEVDLLVNNAGIMAVAFAETVDGFERQLATNHLGHFALTGRLLPLLRGADAARVVTVTSIAGFLGWMRFDDLHGRRRYGAWRAYAQSKLANQLFAFELDRRSEAGGWGVLSLLAHPGLASTGLPRGRRPILAKPGAWVMRVGRGTLLQPARRGARSQLYAATMPDVESGDFWGPALQSRGRPTRQPLPPAATERTSAQLLWDVSEELTGVVYPV